eukprot:1149792-Pelagomonas_calceolata.AAC.3
MQKALHPEIAIVLLSLTHTTHENVLKHAGVVVSKEQAGAVQRLIEAWVSITGGVANKLGAIVNSNSYEKEAAFGSPAVLPEVLLQILSFEMNSAGSFIHSLIIEAWAREQVGLRVEEGVADLANMPGRVDSCGIVGG